jgi:squalene-hopene/tetraprenyl-beta-curcumene cyclase
MNRAALHDALQRTREKLIGAWQPQGACCGRLSGSALSTAIAVCALKSVQAKEDRPERERRIEEGLRWLVENQNSDGGFGDTIDSPSNISTTTLCWVALSFLEEGEEALQTARRVEDWLRREMGELTTERLCRTIQERYGTDRTFAVPILTTCALGGKLGEGRAAWRFFPSLPFELAACPHGWWAALGLPMVSYALPALIALGQIRHHKSPSRNPLVRGLRAAAKRKTLRVLESIQPSSGGYLEATPLTSFVVLSLVNFAPLNHPVVVRGLKFLEASQRADGCWPIDSNLDTWTTTLSVQALAAGEERCEALPADLREDTRTWLLQQQLKEEHPYTHAAPGGWAWTDLSGGVPDADDTPGALLALWHLARRSPSGEFDDEEVLDAAARGITWLLDLQNRDGGIPTFCRGWSKLPFDRSSPDITAHVLRAWSCWRGLLPGRVQERVQRATTAALDYLCAEQREDGAWIPSWFGNQAEAQQENPLYGTTRILRVLVALESKTAARATDDSVGDALSHSVAEASRKGLEWLLAAQGVDGGFGAAAGIAPSIEETALAVEALADLLSRGEPVTGSSRSERHGEQQIPREAIQHALTRATDWLLQATQDGRRFPASPIGLYFAKLWYSEELYPVLFSASALGRVLQLQAAAEPVR